MEQQNLQDNTDIEIDVLELFHVLLNKFWIILLAGIIAGLAFIVLEAKRRNENQDAYVGMMITAVIFGLIGARLFYVGFSW